MASGEAAVGQRSTTARAAPGTASDTGVTTTRLTFTSRVDTESEEFTHHVGAPPLLAE